MLRSFLFSQLRIRLVLNVQVLVQGPWTVFAPDNEAWQALPKEIFDHIVSDPVLLKQILSYHVVQANATRPHLSNDLKLPSLYENRPIHINFYTDGWASVRFP